MDIRATPGTLRGKFRSASPTVTARKLDASKVGVSSLQIPSSRTPNTPVPWSFTVENRTNVNFLMPEWCPSSRLTNASGVLFAVKVLLDGEVVSSNTRCVPDEGGSVDFSGEFFSPTEPGSYDVGVRVETVPNGQTVVKQDTTLEVTEDSAIGGCPDGFVFDPQTDQCVPTDRGGNGGGGAVGLIQTALKNLPAIVGLIVVLFLLGTFSDLM